MNKQKQIEEMAKVVRRHICEDKPCEECYYHGFRSKILSRYCEAYIHAEMLYNAGYRKIPENAVVNERLEDLLIEFDEMGFSPTTTHPYPNAYASNWKLRLAYAIGQLCKEKEKETAEKFAERVKEKFAYDIERCKAIDEICKEIIEKGVQNGN